VISVHVPPGDASSTVDWSALARTDGTLVLLMALDRIGPVARTLIKHGRSRNCPVSVIADGTLPTQRTIYSTLEHVERRLAEEGVRPPAVVVIGDVVTIAAELAELGRALGGGDRDGLGVAPSPVPPLAADLIKRA
jgi:uroporphyrin-III C-methyltransferase/precorrin-2 dehydrogenase/sirohydrochlorin ferrochelatase